MNEEVRGNQFAIDARHLQSGIGTYTRNLLRGLKELQVGRVHVITRPVYRREVYGYADKVTGLDVPSYSVREQVAMPIVTRGDAFLHVPHYNVPLMYPGKLLVTIHDVTHLLYEEYRRGWKVQVYGRPMLCAAAKKAAHIFTVSEYAKRTISEYLGVNENKISVVYNAVAEMFAPGDIEGARALLREVYGLRRPFILYVGNMKPHKNIETLLRAYAQMCSGKATVLDLVIAGRDQSGRKRLEEYAKELRIAPYFIVDAEGDTLVALYRAAEVLVLPSFEEGFGLPMVEAMACGTPVVCANSASMPEVAAGAALLFDPRCANSLRLALEQVLSCGDLKRSMRELGICRARRFSCKAVALLHLRIYRECLEG